MLRALALDGIDAVIHRARLSNDPLGEFAPDLTEEINHAGTVRLATLAKQAGIARFVSPSSLNQALFRGSHSIDEEHSRNQLQLFDF